MTDPIVLGGPSDTSTQTKESDGAQKAPAIVDYDADDTTPPDKYAPAEEQKAYQEELKTYIDEMYECFTESSYKGEDLWTEFTISFRPSSISRFSRHQLMKWSEFMADRGVFITRKRGFAGSKLLLQCLAKP